MQRSRQAESNTKELYMPHADAMRCENASWSSK
jgi:hypothetical protein